MLDDNRDSAGQRNQLLVILLVTVLVVGWSFFFMPQNAPPPQEPASEQPAAEQAAADEEPAPAQPETEPEPAEAPEPPPESEPPDQPRVLPTDAADEVPSLPPIPEPDDPQADEVALSHKNLELAFTRIGARLKRATVVLGPEGRDSVQLVPIWRDTPDTEAVYPLGLRFEDDYLGDELDRRRWDAQVSEDGQSVRFSITLPGHAEVVKTFRFNDVPNVLDIDVAYTNLGEQGRRLGMDTRVPAFSLNWGPNVNSGDAEKGVKQEIVWRREGDNENQATAKLKPRNGEPFHWEQKRDVEWLAVRSAYFVVALKPDFENALGWTWGTPQHFRMGVGAPRFQVSGQETTTRGFRAYLGPSRGELLAQAWPTLDSVWTFFSSVKIMDRFAKLLLGVLNWFHGNLYANYGVAIIFLTLLVRLIMFPLTLKSMKSMKKMQMLAPEIEKIKEEAGDDQQEIQKRTMEMYKERGVNPLGGCFPLLLQMPVFIALYRMLWSAFELRRAPFFLWIQDLSEPDAFMPLPFTIPIPFVHGTVETLNLLPILMGLSMVASQKLMPTSGPAQSQQQKIMMTAMPVIFCVICYNMAAGLNLYILTSTLLGIAQNYLVRASDVDVEPKKPKTKKKAATGSRHFYTAAQARKRQLAKETRREKKSSRSRRADSNSKRSGKKRP